MLPQNSQASKSFPYSDTWTNQQPLIGTRLSIHDLGIWICSPPSFPRGFPDCSVVKNLPTLQETQEMWVQSLGREDPQRRKWQLTPVFLPGKSHGKRNMAGYSPWGCKESDTTEQLSISSFPKWHELMMPLSYGSQRVQWFRNRNHEGHKEESIWTLDYLDALRGRC